MVKLSLTEKQMLDGKFGKGTQTAMKIQVAIAEAFDAPYMVPISRAHVALSNQEADLWFVEKLVSQGAKCKIRPTVNPSFNWEQMSQITSLSSEDVDIVRRTDNAYKKIGALMTYDCTPYLQLNVPKVNDVISYSESSATPFVNSVYGAKTNRESAQSALCAAVTGVVPYYGYLMKENRKGEILVNVLAKMDSDFDFQLLGYVLPLKIGFKIPVFNFINKEEKRNFSNASLMNLGAQMNTSGNVAIYHILGYTPEASTLEDAFQSSKVPEEVDITQEDLDSVRDKISAPIGKIDFALFGCPHLTFEQIERVTKIIAGKKLAVPLFIMSSDPTMRLCEQMGILKTIEEAGGNIISNTCMDQPCWKFLYGKKGVTDSPKCAYYTKRRKMEFVITDLENATYSALEGEVTSDRKKQFV
ncbi:MAG: aconitase X catalytic domain-containing protein [Liquorilactobacillus mali]